MTEQETEKAAQRLLSGVPETIYNNPWVQDALEVLHVLEHRLNVREKLKKPRGELIIVNHDLGPVTITVWYDKDGDEIESVMLAGLTNIYDILNDDQVKVIKEIIKST